MALQQSVDSTNYARLARLILDQGTAQLRYKCIANLIHGTSLKDALFIQRNVIHALHKRNIINDIQLNILYPGCGSDPLVDDIDMTLWLVLIRNMTKRKNRINWAHPEKDTVKYWQHYALRLKGLRNDLFHLPNPELTTTKFTELWGATAFVLRQLGVDNNVLNDYYNEDLDPVQTKVYILQVREQVLQDLHGVCMFEAKRRKQLMIIIPLAIVVALAISACFVAPMVIYLRVKPPCTAHMSSISSSDLGVMKYLTRSDWGAVAPRSQVKKLRTPVQNVLLMHTANVGKCQTIVDCCDYVLAVQKYSLKEFDDINYNYLLGANEYFAVAMEGRGSQKIGAAIHGWNNISISISVIGNFMLDKPDESLITGLRILLHHLVNETILESNYTLYAHCDLNPHFPDSPGYQLYTVVEQWKQFKHMNGSNCSKYNRTCH